MKKINSHTYELSPEMHSSNYIGDRTGELYDRKNDPQELNNCWNDPSCAQVKTELMNQLMEEVICSFDVANGRRQKPSPPQAIKWIAKHNQSEQ